MQSNKKQNLVQQNLYLQIIYLLKKEVIIEWRQRYALNGIILYVVSTIFLVYMAFKQPKDLVWLTLFWIIMLFASVNALTKSFMQENNNRFLYYYSMVSPQAVILSKILYNILLLLVLAFFQLLFYMLFLGNPISNLSLFLLTVFLGVCSFSLCFTLISAIAAKASKNATLMPILSFPIIMPILLYLIIISKSALVGINETNLNKDISILIAIDGIILVLSYLLFPYLWQE